MSTTISLNDGLAQRMQVEAEARHTSVDSIANRVLERIFPAPLAQDESDLLKIVALIRETAPDADAIRAARPIGGESSLVNGAATADFDEGEWNRQWAEFEAGLKAQSFLNELAEGRG